jgi:nucleoside-diphosphate-sugar epimerase
MVQTVAVTGATGFIGRALLNRLTVSGWGVRALTRRASPKMDYSSVKWIPGDLDDTRALRHMVEGAEVVIHCAGAVKGKSWDDFFHTNVIGTKNILQAISEIGSCPKFLYISSLAAREPQLSWYAQSKFEAEQLISKFSERLTAAVFRPAAVYGPGDKAMKPLFRLMRYGVLPALGAPDNRFGLIHVDDLVTAVSCWLDAEHSITGTYEIDDGTPEGYDYVSIAAIAQGVLGKPVRCFRIPCTGIRLFAHCNIWLAHLFNYAPMLTPGKVRELQHPDWTCDISSLKRELSDWHPAIGFHAALPALVRHNERF